jgi:hypothetical protein
MKNPHNKKVLDQELSGEMLIIYAQQLVVKNFPIIGDAFKIMIDHLIGKRLK